MLLLMQMQTAEGVAVWLSIDSVCCKPYSQAFLTLNLITTEEAQFAEKNQQNSLQGAVLGQQLEAQQKVPLKQMYLISAIRSILWQSQMIQVVCHPESTQLSRNFWAKLQDSSQDQNQK